MKLSPLSLLFLVLIFLPGLVHGARALIGKTPDVLADENRAPAPWPSAAGGWRETAAGLEPWLADRAGLRSLYLSAYRSLREELGLVTADEQAVEGRDGYLFFSQGGRLQADFEGRAPLTAAEAAAWAERLRGVRDAVAPAAFAVLVAPDKQSVYPDKVSPAYRHRPEAMRRPNLVPVLRGAGLIVIDPTAALTETRSVRETYYRTDTHWTAWGAYTAYRELMDALIAQGLEVPVLPPERVSAGAPQEGWSGDLPTMLARGERSETRVPLLIEGGQRPSPRIVEDGANADLHTEVYGGGPEGSPTLTVYGDSFAPPLVPYLLMSFSDVTVIRRFDELVDLARLAEHPADVIVVEIVERTFRALPQR